MSKQELQVRRVALIGALVVLLVGGVLIVAPALLSLAAPTPAQQNSAAAIPADSTSTDMAAPASLPTIARPTAAPATALPAADPISTPAIRPDASAGSLPTAVTAQLSRTTDSQLTARLVAHLTCIQPGTHHDVMLDTRAADLARQATTPLPQAGAIQTRATDGQYLFLSADAVADLRAGAGRCGETLIFGIPPLDWLPNGARFGLGVDVREGGAVVAIVAQ